LNTFKISIVERTGDVELLILARRHDTALFAGQRERLPWWRRSWASRAADSAADAAVAMIEDLLQAEKARRKK